MVILYQKDQGLNQGINAASTALGQALQSRFQNQQQLKQQDAQQQKKFQYDIMLERAKQLMKDQAASNFWNTEILGNNNLSEEQGQPLLTREAGTNGQQIGANQQFSSPIQQIAQAQSNPLPEPEEEIDITKINEGNLGSLTDVQVSKLVSSRFPQFQRLGDMALKQKEQTQRKFEADRKYYSQNQKEIEKYASGIRRALPGQKAALELGRQAIETGETGPASWANVANRLGIKELMNQAGTQLNQAGKEFFFGNMMRVSARAQNQWLEQRITQLAAEIGDPKIVALTKQAMLEADLSLGEEFVKSYDQLKQEDMKRLGYVKYDDIEERAFQRSLPATEEITKEAAYKTRNLYEQDIGVEKLTKNINKKVSKGTPLTDLTVAVMSKDFKRPDGTIDASKLIEKAKKLGYTIPTKEQRNKWQ